MVYQRFITLTFCQFDCFWFLKLAFDFCCPALLEDDFRLYMPDLGWWLAGSNVRSFDRCGSIECATTKIVSNKTIISVTIKSSNINSIPIYIFFYLQVHCTRVVLLLVLTCQSWERWLWRWRWGWWWRWRQWYWCWWRLGRSAGCLVGLLNAMVALDWFGRLVWLVWPFWCALVEDFSVVHFSLSRNQFHFLFLLLVKTSNLTKIHTKLMIFVSSTNIGLL